MRRIEYRQAVREAMSEEMRKDPLLFLMAYDIGQYGGEFRTSTGMWEEFGDRRVQDAPISEQGIVGLAVGASITGTKAIVEIPFMDFIPMAMDQICNQAAKFLYTFGGQQGVPLVLRTAMGGFIRAGEQHSQCLENWFVHIPGLKVIMPSTPYDAKGLLKTAINDPDPVICIEHKFMYPMKGEVPEEEYTIPFGVADVKRSGTDVTVIATSYMVHKALNVAAKLEADGISVEVVDPRTLVPLDEETILGSVRKTNRVVIVHEAVTRGGWGGEMAAIIAEKAFGDLDGPVLRVGAKNTPIPAPGILEDFVLPSEADIEAAIRRLVRPTS
jgi:pyruvate/2-oxoglutarate/acetoin dehydrogenase E1 component